MKIFKEIESLSNSLAEFGLCPSDWVISEEDNCIYKIENIAEPCFYFKGRIRLENGHKKWGSIQLAGL